MCSGSCGSAIRQCLNECLESYKQEGIVSKQAQLILDAEPESLGLHRIYITIENNNHLDKTELSKKFKAAICAEGFEIMEHSHTPENTPAKKLNWLNMIINLAAIAGIIILSLLFPPSLLLTIGLTTLSLLTTAFTGRYYLINFIRNLRNKSVANMTTTITLGWALSAAHTLYHAITMVLITSFSMIFMGFIMPLVLIALINGMDEIKRLITNKSKKMHLSGMRMLFPEMSEEYPSYQQADNEANQQIIFIKKNALKKDMIIEVKRGECFPIDCVLIRGNTFVDASLLTGEPQQLKRLEDTIPAGAINLGDTVLVQATNDAYDSTVNKLLFRSNRAKKSSINIPNKTFHYLYSTLIIIGLATAIIAPFALGILTIPLLLQNMTGILFAICPCTIAIAHQLPRLLTTYRRSHKGITVRDESICEQTNDSHTIVFDKTGTLTTGDSQVESVEGINQELWHRVYLLEKNHGSAHPLAKAICQYKSVSSNIINDIQDVSIDSRGLKGTVQGKTIHLGNLDYLRESGVGNLPINNDKAHLGFTPVYVAEDNLYQGVIYIKHDIRKDIVEMLSRFKREGKKIIMLTGDTQVAALGFNAQNDSIFDPKNIHAGKTPLQKERFLDDLMSAVDVNPKGIWFVGDGLNDAPCARLVSERGGISCAMTSSDKAAFFTDISLNGELNYLSHHDRINRFLNKIVHQNQGLLFLGSIASLIFIISFSLVGIAVSPIIPLIIMVSTTLMVVFNTSRVQHHIDTALDQDTSRIKRLLASDLSIALLIAGCALLMAGILIATFATGGLALPVIAFSVGAITALSSAFIVAATVCFSLFTILASSYLVFNKCSEPILNLEKAVESTTSACCTERSEKTYSTIPGNTYSGALFQAAAPAATNDPPLRELEVNNIPN